MGHGNGTGSGSKCWAFLFVSLGWKAFMRGNDTSLTILMCLKMGDARWQCSNGHKDDDSITPWHSGVPYFENLPLISAVINIPQILHVSPCQVRLAILWGIWRIFFWEQWEGRLVHHICYHPPIGYYGLAKNKRLPLYNPPSIPKIGK